MSDVVSKARFTIVFSELNKLLDEDIPLEQIWVCAYKMLSQVDELKKCYNKEIVYTKLAKL